MSFDKKLKRIKARDWDFIQSKWLRYLPSIYPIGSAPADSLSEHPTLAAAVMDVDDNGEKIVNIGELRPALFHESVYLLHKAINVIEATENHFQNGFPTWSLSSAYHSAFFAVKSLMGFLGVCTPRISSSDYVIDMWPEPEELSSKKRKLGEEPQIFVKLIKQKSLQHNHIWQILQRLVIVVDTELWPESYSEFVKSIGHLDFAFQRNSLHYNKDWILNDIHERLFLDAFGRRGNLEIDLARVNKNSEDFSVVLCYVLISMSYSLFNSIAETAPIISEERDLMRTKLRRITSHAFIQ